MADKKKGKLEEAMVEPLMAAGEAIKAAGQKAAENSVALTSKVIDHAEANTREAFAALRAAAQSTSVNDVMKVQGDYVREQSARAMEHAREIGDLIAQFGRETMSSIKGKID